jgi:hypothetical protein
LLTEFPGGRVRSADKVFSMLCAGTLLERHGSLLEMSSMVSQQSTRLEAGQYDAEKVHAEEVHVEKA